MKLENIGFYTLSDERAKNSSATSPLMRNELIITSLCNFKCLYCRENCLDVCIDYNNKWAEVYGIKRDEIIFTQNI